MVLVKDVLYTSCGLIMLIWEILGLPPWRDKARIKFPFTENSVHGAALMLTEEQ